MPTADAINHEVLWCVQQVWHVGGRKSTEGDQGGGVGTKTKPTTTEAVGLDAGAR